MGTAAADPKAFERIFLDFRRGCLVPRDARQFEPHVFQIGIGYRMNQQFFDDGLKIGEGTNGGKGGTSGRVTMQVALGDFVLIFKGSIGGEGQRLTFVAAIDHFIEQVGRLIVEGEVVDDLGCPSLDR